MPLVEKPLAPKPESATKTAPMETKTMLLRFALSAAMLAAAAPALAQPPAAPAAPPASSSAPPSAAPTGPAAAIQPAAMAYSQCLSAGVAGVAATATPEAGATSVMNGCAAQRTALDQAVEGLLTTLPAEQQAAGRAQYQSQIGEVPTQIAGAIRQSRAPATPAAPATTPH
jgi:hypothetical protein